MKNIFSSPDDIDVIDKCTYRVETRIIIYDIEMNEIYSKWYNTDHIKRGQVYDFNYDGNFSIE